MTRWSIAGARDHRGYTAIGDEVTIGRGVRLSGSTVHPD